MRVIILHVKTEQMRRKFVENSMYKVDNWRAYLQDGWNGKWTAKSH